jgi:ribosomal protein S27AE
MKQLAIVTAAITVIAVLIGILVAVVYLAIDGITVTVKGTVSLENASGGIDLSMSEPVNLVASGQDGKGIPADLAIFRCPKCGGTMLPVQFNVINGEITWKCTKCGYTINGNEGSSP